MQLPESLQSALEKSITSFGLNKLIEAREELTERYRKLSSNKSSSPFITTEAQRQAYVISRMPATYAAIQASLEAIERQLPNWEIESLLDLGAGPGTASWVASEQFSQLQQITLIEQDQALAKLGQALAQSSELSVLREACWQISDLEQLERFPQHDLVIFSYSIGELKSDKMLSILEKAWMAANKLLLVIEPGTPVGFERIRLIRRHLIELGGHLAAPCPHHLACPMANGDWCHFAARVERSSLHRRLKGGKLGYEDEKFSYVASAKERVDLPETRVLRHPQHHSGHIELKLCTAEGVQYPIISKKSGNLYKIARKLEWGDPFIKNQSQAI